MELGRGLILGGALTVLLVASGIVAWSSFYRPPVTTEACIGGIASYSKEEWKRETTGNSGGGIDTEALAAKIEAQSKNSTSSTTVTSTDPEIQRISQLCWQPCQAWAASSGQERKQLLELFTKCMSAARAAKFSTEQPQPPAVVSQTAGNAAVLVGRDNFGDITVPAATGKPE